MKRLFGVLRDWRENGQQSVETHFKNAQRHGSNRYWNPEGKLTKEQLYDHDKSVSEVHHQPLQAIKQCVPTDDDQTVAAGSEPSYDAHHKNETPWKPREVPLSDDRILVLDAD